MMKDVINFVIHFYGFGNILQGLVYHYKSLFVTTPGLASFVSKFLGVTQLWGMIISAILFLSWIKKSNLFFKLLFYQAMYNGILSLLYIYILVSRIFPDMNETKISNGAITSTIHIIGATLLLTFHKELLRLFPEIIIIDERRFSEPDYKEMILCYSQIPEDTCSICLEDKMNSVIGVLGCNHSFHSECILDWIRTDENASCPLCRKEM